MAMPKLPPWLRPKTSHPIEVSVCWYTEEEWSRVKAAATDPERSEASYAEWVNMAEDAGRQLLGSGVEAKRMFVASNDLLAWCLAHNLADNAASRARYVSELGSKQPSDA